MMDLRSAKMKSGRSGCAARPHGDQWSVAPAGFRCAGLAAMPSSGRSPLTTSHARTGASGSSVVPATMRSEEHTSELQSLMRISYAVFCLKKKSYLCNHYLSNFLSTNIFTHYIIDYTTITENSYYYNS